MPENRPFMPPPPKELRKVQEEKVEEKTTPDASVVTPQPVVEKKKVEKKVKEKPQKTAPVEENSAPVENVQDKPEDSSSGLKKALYWIGFGVSLVAIGVLIYLLIK